MFISQINIEILVHILCNRIVFIEKNKYNELETEFGVDDVWSFWLKVENQ